MAEVMNASLARYDVLSYLVASLVVFTALGMAYKAWKDNKRSPGFFDIDHVQFLMTQVERVERNANSRLESTHRRLDHIENRVVSLERRRGR